MIEVKKRDKESPESLIRRFSRRVQQSGVLVQARRARFRADVKTKREMRQGAMYKEKVKKVVTKLKKMGKFDEGNFRNVKKKLVK
jgi:ribosomal protein S21